ncbi:hypothetical protein [Streptomyces sp. NPDC056010]|uniref:hypothetical protein n=1 Tax=Streptomyces sp. NPDC056010 TaxID=3345679 RepID=UPI0035D765D4
MITSTPVGEWVWELSAKGPGFGPGRAAQTAMEVWHRLTDAGLARPGERVGAGLPERNEPRGPTVVRIDCPGTWLEPGGTYRAEKLFAVQVEVWGGTLLVATLETYSDAWLTMDTRGREQPEVYALNAPRLAAALDGISALLGGPPEPGEENRYAAPSTTGFRDVRAEGHAYDDAWGTFETLDRTRLLDSRLPRSEDDYEQIADGPVRYVAVRRDDRTLGFVWAAVDDSAAGYVPRTAAGDEAFDAGAAWVMALREARRSGLTPLAALRDAVRRPAPPEAGVIAQGGPVEAPSLDALEELSGRY